MGKLDGKVAVITGGNSGIGLATAKLFQAEGAQVVVTARNQTRLEESRTEVGEGIDVIQADVSKVSEITAFFEQIAAKYGKIDILFANAGIAKFAPIEYIDENFIDNMFNVNFKGVFFSVQKSLPLFKDGGSILINTSVSNTKGMPNTSTYAATKAAGRSLARTLSSELIGKGIRVNAISPGPVSTPIYGKLGLAQEEIDEFGKQALAQVPMGRFGESAELAKAALFLASKDSSFVVGTELVVDGGMTQL